MRWSNCLFFARQRRRVRGGFIVSVQSAHGPWLHRFWTADFETFETFECVSARLDRVYRWLSQFNWPVPPLVFPGTVKLYSRADVTAKFGLTV